MGAAVLGMGACGTRNEVVVLGMIHGGHRESETYGIEQLAEAIRRIDPDYVLVEIPPDRIEAATVEFRETGEITEARVRVFPEYVDVLFPLTREIDFEIIACAAWTRPMADARRAKLIEWRTSRPEDTTESDRAQAEAEARIQAEGADDDPLFIHTERYDEIVRAGLEPYDRLFNDDLGPGGWENINAAHYALIAEALDAHTGEGKRFLITFGAWHKYWFLEQLRQRDDIVLIDPRRYFR